MNKSLKHFWWTPLSERVVMSVLYDYGTSIDDVVGTSRRRRLRRVRAECVHALQDAGYTYAEIGKLMGDRHATTVRRWLRWLPKGGR